MENKIKKLESIYKKLDEINNIKTTFKVDLNRDIFYLNNDSFYVKQGCMEEFLDLRIKKYTALIRTYELLQQMKQISKEYKEIDTNHLLVKGC